jgi:hypothetical protein
MLTKSAGGHPFGLSQAFCYFARVSLFRDFSLPLRTRRALESALAVQDQIDEDPWR